MSINKIYIPNRRRGKPTPESKEQYLGELRGFAEAILEIDSTLDFKVSSRGWCYTLEPFGLSKGDFDLAQKKINECRKNGLLPMDFCSTDESRKFSHVENIGELPEEEVDNLIAGISEYIEDYSPISFWCDQKYYLQMLVEKVDLRTLFGPICRKYHIPLANSKGWSDMNQRYALMRRFKFWESQGKICRLLYCGDFDPDGQLISDTLMENMNDMKWAVEWAPAGDMVDRFGLNEDFIDQYNLSWIDGLITSSKKDLADPRHKRHNADYVQDWLDRYGPRKVEANALVVRSQEGRKLCEKTISKYVDASAPKRFQEQGEPYRKELLNRFKIQIRQLGK